MRGYPNDWGEIAAAVKDEAGWRCERCGEAHNPSNWFTLTVHHRDKDPMNCNPDNLVALCQRCHLKTQAVLRRYGPRALCPVFPGFPDPR